jgi:alcohol dehydrogenase
MNDYSFTIPTRLYAGKDCSLRLGEVAATAGERAVLVADSLLARSPILASLEAALRERGIESISYSDVEAGATARTAEEIIKTARAGRCQTVIGVGGIRTLSIAKCVAAFAHEADSLDPYIDGQEAGTPPLSYIGIPTSARDPFACTQEMLIVDPRSRASRILTVEGFFPRAVFFDPSLSVSLSEAYFSAVVLESVLSAVEGYLSAKSSLVSDTLLEKAFSLSLAVLNRLIDGEKYENLIPSVTEAGVLEALAFSSTAKGPGTALAYALNGRLLAPKVAVTAALAIPLLEHPGMIQGIERLASACGESHQSLLDAVKRLVTAKGFSLRLQDLGMRKNDCSEIAATARAFPFIPYFPILKEQDELFEFLGQLL